MFPQTADSSITAIDAAFVATAPSIGKQVYRYMQHTSPWFDLTKQVGFDSNLGKEQQVLIYNRSLPTTDAAGNTDGVNWFGTSIAEGSTRFDESLLIGEQPIGGTPNKHAGAYGGDQAIPEANLAQDQRSYVQFSKKVKTFTLRNAVITAPKINLDDLRYATQRKQQVDAIMEILNEVTSYVWENRYRDEFERVTENVVFMKQTGTKIQTKVAAGASVTSVDPFSGVMLEDINQLSTSGVGDTDVTPDARISNKIMNRIYNQLIRKGAGKNDPYGMQDGRPVFGLIVASEMAEGIQNEDNFRVDRQHDAGSVAALLKPLGVERAHRGFYHINDDLAPRYKVNADKLVRELPYTTTGGITNENDEYDNAPIEVAYVHHSKVSESQIPNPFGSVGAMQFDAKTATGKFGWYNIQSEANPDRQIGYFKGSLASATKPIRTDYGYTLVYDRTATAYAA